MRTSAVYGFVHADNDEGCGSDALRTPSYPWLPIGNGGALQNTPKKRADPTAPFHLISGQNITLPGALDHEESLTLDLKGVWGDVHTQRADFS